MWSKKMAQPKEMAIATDASRVLQFVADNIEDPEFAEDLRIYFNLPIMVPEILLPGRVTRQHFLQWHPRVFMPGSIWRTVSFLPDGKITDYEYYLFVAVVFFVENRMREGEPRVWRELSLSLSPSPSLPLFLLWTGAARLHPPGRRRPLRSARIESPLGIRRSGPSRLACQHMPFRARVPARAAARASAAPPPCAPGLHAGAATRVARRIRTARAARAAARTTAVSDLRTGVARRRFTCRRSNTHSARGSLRAPLRPPAREARVVDAGRAAPRLAADPPRPGGGGGGGGALRRACATAGTPAAAGEGVPAGRVCRPGGPAARAVRACSVRRGPGVMASGTEARRALAQWRES